jgi:hypothetical protein
LRKLSELLLEVASVFQLINPTGPAFNIGTTTSIMYKINEYVATTNPWLGTGNNIYYTNISYDDGFGSQYQKIIQTYIYCKMNNLQFASVNFKSLPLLLTFAVIETQFNLIIDWPSTIPNINSI